jgi:serine/threonine protein kinase
MWTPAKGGETYLVMELLEGESAEARVGRGTLIPWREAVHYAHQVAAALVAVHATGHYHGGLSLAEVFLTPDEAAGERAVLTPLGPSMEPVEEGDGQRADVRAVAELLGEMIGEQRVPPAVGRLLVRAAGGEGAVGTMEELRSALGEISRAADRYNAPPGR